MIQKKKKRREEEGLLDLLEKGKQKTSALRTWKAFDWLTTTTRLLLKIKYYSNLKQLFEI